MSDGRFSASHHPHRFTGNRCRSRVTKKRDNSRSASERSYTLSIGSDEEDVERAEEEVVEEEEEGEIEVDGDERVTTGGTFPPMTRFRTTAHHASKSTQPNRD